jgi:hypothetical protein
LQIAALKFAYFRKNSASSSSKICIKKNSDVAVLIFAYLRKILPIAALKCTYFKEALATILTKKIICFGNW